MRRLFLAALAAALLGGCGAGREPVASAPRWLDVGAERGVTATSWCGSPARDHLLESVGSGVAFLDLDGDTHDDILVLSAYRLEDRPAGVEAPRRTVSRGGLTYYHNRGDGHFEDWTARAGLSVADAWTLGATAGDIDGDGNVDLYVYCFGRNLLFRNRGDGSFEELAEKAGVALDGWSGGAAFFDGDGDGDLDLYVSRYVEGTLAEVLTARRTLPYKGSAEVMVGPFGLKGATDRYYRNRGGGHFEDATEEAGLVDRGEGFGLGILAADLDGDGDQDLYVANDSNPNYLYRNEGGGHFSEIGVVSGAAFDAQGAAQAGMGVAVLDDDGDGSLDLFVTNFADDSSTLYRGEGKLFYSDVTQQVGISGPTYQVLSWGTLPVDLDQDGRVDLLVANGHIYPQVDQIPGNIGYRQRNLVLRNRGGSFEDATDRFGPGFAVMSSFRGLAMGELDGDGCPDLVYSRVDEPPLVLACAGGDRERWLSVEPAGKAYPAWFGARVDVTAGGQTQTRVVLSGGSYASQSALRAVFGLGTATKADKVLVRFPGGATSEFRDVSGGTVLKVPVPAPAVQPR